MLIELTLATNAVTSATVKTCGLVQKIYTIAQGVSGALVLLMILWGCSAPAFNSSNLTWKIYSNSRYGFEFPYPSNWTALTAPENDDGIAFVSPQNNSVEIRGWAVNRLPGSITEEADFEKTMNLNFQTAQGVSGVMLVEVSPQVSLMTLTLTQAQVKYYWQGRSQSQEFPDYYRLFYYIAQQYRIPSRGGR
ncbi:hypothetical protein A6770_16725 [Nostoc minutum NIES-26]|uniref:Uncharacterized protein n=1 Tax=Nostoc minutum NIES-26 TaxID=1844469 RepID=A0A367RE32_9NOSO|nr:hypothetical protein A6770_16725 [Nostoc minutum NIES-26]